MCICILATAVLGTPSLKSYRTATTLCVPDLVFNDISRHKILLPEGTPVQREILAGMLTVVEKFVSLACRSVCDYCYIAEPCLLARKKNAILSTDFV